MMNDDKQKSCRNLLGKYTKLQLLRALSLHLYAAMPSNKPEQIVMHKYTAKYMKKLIKYRTETKVYYDNCHGLTKQTGLMMTMIKCFVISYNRGIMEVLK